MQALLRFELPDDHVEYEMAIKGTDANIALFDIREFLHSKLKYNTYVSIDDCLEDVYKHVNDTIDSYNIVFH